MEETYTYLNTTYSIDIDCFLELSAFWPEVFCVDFFKYILLRKGRQPSGRVFYVFNFRVFSSIQYPRGQWSYIHFAGSHSSKLHWIQFCKGNR